MQKAKYFGLQLPVKIHLTNSLKGKYHLTDTLYIGVMGAGECSNSWILI